MSEGRLRYEKMALLLLRRDFEVVKQFFLFMKKIEMFRLDAFYYNISKIGHSLEARKVGIKFCMKCQFNMAQVIGEFK